MGGTDPSTHAHSVGDDPADGAVRGDMVTHRGRRGDLRSDQHRHALRVYAGEYWGAGVALQGAGAPTPLPCAVGMACVRPFRRRLCVHHAGTPTFGLGTVWNLAGDRAITLL